MRVLAFDLDGTLVDSATEILQTMEAAWREVEGTELPRARFRIGPPLAEAIAALGARDPKTLAQRFRERYDASTFDATRPFPGIPEVLAALGDRTLAVATNKRRAPTEKIVARWFPGRFAALACIDEHADKAAMLRALGADVLVGDTAADVRAARAVGARAVAVTWGYDDAAALRDADVVVADAPGLLAALRTPGT